MDYKKIIRLILAAPLFGGQLLVLIIHALWGAELKYVDDYVLTTTLKSDSWPMRTWYKPWGGTTFGFGIMLAPGMDPRVMVHELRHVKQLEVSSICGLICGMITWLFTWKLAGVLLMLGSWFLSPIMFYICAGIVALLYGQKYYENNIFEEDAESVENK